MTEFSAVPGDRVRTLHHIWKGDYFGPSDLKVPAGSVGTIRDFRQSWSDRHHGFSTVVVVDFPGNPGQRVRPINLEIVADQVLPDAAKARRLANAHQSLTRAYSNLADAQAQLTSALENLKAQS